MGKHKTQRADELRQAARRYAIGSQVQDIIEQHNFDRLVAQGFIVEGPASAEHEDPQVAGVG